MKYYGLNEDEIVNPDQEKLIFYNLVLLLGVLAFVFFIMGVAYNLILGMVGFVGVALVLMFLFIEQERKRWELYQAVKEVPRIQYIPARYFSLDEALKGVDRLGYARMGRRGQ